MNVQLTDDQVSRFQRLASHLGLDLDSFITYAISRIIHDLEIEMVRDKNAAKPEAKKNA